MILVKKKFLHKIQTTDIKSLYFCLIVFSIAIYLYVGNITNRSKILRFNDNYSLKTTSSSNIYFTRSNRKNKTNFGAEFQANNTKIILNGFADVGYGNRLYAFLSSLLMAILLDAHLFTDWPEIDINIQEPFQQSFNKSCYLKYSAIASRNLVYTAISKSPWTVNKNVKMLSQQLIPEDKTIYHFDGIDYNIETEYKSKVVHTLDYIKINKINFKFGKYGTTILDNELMSKSDFLVISGGSTFGFVAAMRKKQLPFYINGKKNQKKCSKMKLSEPSITKSGFAVF
jgi:hypothetical protein